MRPNFLSVKFWQTLWFETCPLLSLRNALSIIPVMSITYTKGPFAYLILHCTGLSAAYSSTHTLQALELISKTDLQQSLAYGIMLLDIIV